MERVAHTEEAAGERESAGEKRYRRAMAVARRRWPEIARAAEHPWVEASLGGRRVGYAAPILVLLGIVALVMMELPRLALQWYLLIGGCTLLIAFWLQPRKTLFSQAVRSSLEVRKPFFGPARMNNTSTIYDLYSSGLPYQAMAAESALYTISQMTPRSVLYALGAAGLSAMGYTFDRNGHLHKFLLYVPALIILLMAFGNVVQVIVVCAGIDDLKLTLIRCHKALLPFRLVIDETFKLFWAAFCIAVCVILLFAVVFLLHGMIALDPVAVTTGASILLLVLSWLYGDRYVQYHFRKSITEGQRLLDEIYSAVNHNIQR